MDYYSQHEQDYYELREDVEEERKILGIDKGEIVYE